MNKTTAKEEKNAQEQKWKALLEFNLRMLPFFQVAQTQKEWRNERKKALWFVAVGLLVC